MVEDAPGTHDTDPAKRLDFFVRTALRGSEELRTQLSIDELVFLHTEPIAANARDFYLYGIADEIARAGTAMLRWVEILAGDDDLENDATALDRAVLTSLLSEQSMWFRRLLESLVDLICFESTNTEPYFLHFILVQRLNDLLAYQANLRDFYGEENANIANSIDRTKSLVGAIEKSEIDAREIWYLRSRKGERNTVSKTARSSFKERLKRALRQADDRHRLIIGLTYQPFAKLSQQIHFTPEEAHVLASPEQLKLGFSAVGILAVAVLHYAYSLGGLEPQTEQGRQLRRVWDANEAASEFHRLHSDPAAQVGDFVLVHNSLAVVVERKTSKFGLVVFLVEYLAERPIQEISEEWIPPTHVRLLFSQRDFGSGVRELLASHGVPAERLIDAPSAEVLRESVVAAWNAGLREAVLSRTA